MFKSARELGIDYELRKEESLRSAIRRQFSISEDGLVVAWGTDKVVPRNARYRMGEFTVSHGELAWIIQRDSAPPPRCLRLNSAIWFTDHNLVSDHARAIHNLFEYLRKAEGPSFFIVAHTPGKAYLVFSDPEASIDRAFKSAPFKNKSIVQSRIEISTPHKEKKGTRLFDIEQAPDLPARVLAITRRFYTEEFKTDLIARIREFDSVPCSDLQVEAAIRRNMANMKRILAERKEKPQPKPELMTRKDGRKAFNARRQANEAE